MKPIDSVLILKITYHILSLLSAYASTSSQFSNFQSDYGLFIFPAYLACIYSLSVFTSDLYVYIMDQYKGGNAIKGLRIYPDSLDYFEALVISGEVLAYDCALMILSVNAREAMFIL